MSPPTTRENSELMNWLREDLRDGIREVREDLKEGIAEIRQEFSKDLEKHAKFCPALTGRPSLAPKSLQAIRVPAWARIAAPLLLSVAIGLIGLGFYMGSGGDTDATARAIRAMTDTTAKLVADVEKIKTAVDAGEEP